MGQEKVKMIEEKMRQLKEGTILDTIMIQRGDDGLLIRSNGDKVVYAGIHPQRLYHPYMFVREAIEPVDGKRGIRYYLAPASDIEQLEADTIWAKFLIDVCEEGHSDYEHLNEVLEAARDIHCSPGSGE